MLTGTETSKQNWVEFYPIRLIPVKSKFLSEALLDLLDPGLERSHVLLQLCEVALDPVQVQSWTGGAAAIRGRPGTVLSLQHGEHLALEGAGVPKTPTHRL